MRKYFVILLLFACSISFGQDFDFWLPASKQQAAPSGYSLAGYSPTWVFVLDSTSIDASVTTDGGDLDEWLDVSGNGVDFTQSVAADKPHLDLVSTQREINVNGQWFDAPNNTVGEIVLGTDERVIIFKEGNLTNSNGTFLSKAISTSSERNFQIYRSGSDTNTIVNLGGTTETFGTSDGVPSGVTNRVWVIEIGTSTWNAWCDGVHLAPFDITLDTTYGDHSGQSINIGARTDGSFEMNGGNLQFVAMAEGTLSAGDLDNIWTALRENF